MSRALALAAFACAVLACGPKDHAKAGYEALREGKNDVAIDELRAALLQDEAQPDVHYDLGVAYENVGWEAKALPELERAVALDPKNEQFRGGLAETKRTLGYRAATEKRYADAARLDQETLLLAPNDATTWYNLSVALRSLKRMDEAKGALARAVELDPKHFAGKEKAFR
ncbi:MAG TPA: tetratricopeptide repeat protein [Byssovorax sp.]|jgi:Flp pilus assembly protein TadD